MISKILDYQRKIGTLAFFLLLLYLLNPMNYGFLIGYLLIIVIVLKIDFVRNNLDFSFIILLFYSISYSLFYSINIDSGIQFVFIYAFTPPFLYLWGKYLAVKSKNSDHLLYVLIAIGTIFSLPGLISVLLNIIEGGFAQGSRSIPMFYSDLPINATGMGALFLLNMCIPAVLLTNFLKIKNWLKIVLIIIFALSIACVLRLGSRTQLVVALITFLVGLIYVMPKQTIKQNISLFALLSIGFYLVFQNVSFDLDADWMTSFVGRIQKSGTSDIASGGGRTDRWIKSMHYLFEKPLGWDVKEFGHSHNLWFDTLRAGGVICFSLLLFFSWKSFLKMISVIKLDRNNISFNIIILTYFLAFNLLFMVEPILEGSFSIFVIFCLFMGIINKYYSLNVIKA